MHIQQAPNPATVAAARGAGQAPSGAGGATDTLPHVRQKGNKVTQITVSWKASEKLQKQEYAETGEKPSAHRKFHLDLAELTPKQCKPIVEHLGLYCFMLSMKHTRDFDKKIPGSSYLRAYSQDYDRQPIMSDILSYVALEADARNEAQTHKAKVDAKKKATRKLLQMHYDNTRQEINALVESGDLTELEEFRFPVRGVADFRPDRGSRITLAKLLADAIKDASKAKRKGDKADWIAAYGSAHLRRAHAGDYDAQRLYVTERAAAEAPGFVVDFDEGAKWKDRTCPTPEALDAEAEAEMLPIGGQVMVVWLTAPAQNTVEDYDYYDFEECEAVVIRDYLGCYDLVRVL